MITSKCDRCGFTTDNPILMTSVDGTDLCPACKKAYTEFIAELKSNFNKFKERWLNEEVA